MQRGEISTEYTCCHAARPIAELGAADTRAAASRAELGELAPAHIPHAIRASEAAWSVLPKLVLMRAPPPGCSLSPGKPFIPLLLCPTHRCYRSDIRRRSIWS